jgi:hypothetical protein
MRTDECLTCDTTFVVEPRHPMWELGYCPACWAVLRIVWAEGYAPGMAMRAEDV